MKSQGTASSLSLRRSLRETFFASDPPHQRERRQHLLARVLRMLTIASVLVLLSVATIDLVGGHPGNWIRLYLVSTLGCAVFLSLSLINRKRGPLIPATLLIATLVGFMMLADNMPNEIVRGRTFFFFVLPIAAASFLVRDSAGLITAAVISPLLTAIAATNDLDPPVFESMGLFIVAFLCYLWSNNLEGAINEVAATNAELSELNRTLDARIEQRSAELIAAQDTLTENAQMSSTVLSSIADAVLVVTQGLAVRVANPAAANLLRRPETEIIGSSFPDLVAQDSSLTEEDRTVLLSLLSSAGGDAAKARVQWGTRTLHMSVSQLAPGVADQPADRVAILTDFTGQAAREQMQLDFASVASHEMRGPLTVIDGYARLLLNEDRLDDALVRHVEAIASSASELEVLTEDLLALGELEARSPDESEVVDIDEVVAAVARTAKQDFDSAGLTLGIEPVVTGLQVLGTARRLEQLLGNLVSNAAKYTEVGGAVIQVGESDNEVLMSVKDTGLGIPGPEISRLFDPFFRGSNQRIREKKGTGFGLHIARLIAESHGGKLTAANHPEGGAVFTARLPRLATDHSGDDSPAGPPSVSHQESAATILVVEDNQDVRFLLTSALRDAGFSVVDAPNGLMALEELNAHPVAMAIVDLEMPVMDGPSFVLNLREEQQSSIPVIIVSGKSSSQIAEFREEFGAMVSAVYRKPIDLQKLLSNVRSLAGTSDSRPD